MKVFPISVDITARILLGLLLISSVVASGYQGRSGWIILAFTSTFTILYFMGKKGSLQALRSRGVVGRAMIVIPTLGVQAVLCSVLYFMGRGVGSLLDVPYNPMAGAYDIVLPAGMLCLCAVITLILSRMTRTAVPPEAAIPADYYGKSHYAMRFEEGPITADNFFTGLYYRDNKAEKNITTPEMIAEAESRLGIVLPPLLRSLYMRQNGGYVEKLWVAAVENPTLDYKDWRGVFSHDYCYLLPLEKLCTLHDSYLDFLSEEDIAADDSLPKDAKHYIILCQRYMDTTFLDYSQSSDNPRVGIVDFDSTHKIDVWFESFDAFFASLRRGELE